MTWFKVDDLFGDHPKVNALLDGEHAEAALSLWLLAGCWCAQQLTNGKVPTGRVRRFGVRDHELAAAELVRVGLWIETADGFEFHEWTHHQPTRESVLAERERKARNQRERRRRQAGESPGVSPATSPVTSPPVTAPVTGDKPVSHHVPTRPDPTSSTSNSHHDRSSGCADAPAPAGMVDPMARARALLVQGYQCRYRQAARDEWMGMARAHTDIGTVAAWCAAKPEQLERRVNALLDGVFADEWMTANRWPWGNIARDPARWARTASDAKPDEPTPYQRLLRKLDLAEQRGDWDAIDRIRAELNAMAGAA